MSNRSLNLTVLTAGAVKNSLRASRSGGRLARALGFITVTRSELDELRPDDVQIRRDRGFKYVGIVATGSIKRSFELLDSWLRRDFSSSVRR